jgi:uncharacterized membrane protein YidH (DUF202 family)
MEDLVDQLTRGNVPQVKTALASVVVALAIYQVCLMAVGYGRVRTRLLKPRAAAFAHRAVGDTIVVITLGVAFMCLTYFGVEEHAADDEDARAALHVVAASLLLGVLALKIVVLRWWHRMDRYLPALGLTVFTLFAITWWSSAGDYLLGG